MQLVCAQSNYVRNETLAYPVIPKLFQVSVWLVEISYINGLKKITELMAEFFIILQNHSPCYVNQDLVEHRQMLSLFDKTHNLFKSRKKSQPQIISNCNLSLLINMAKLILLVGDLSIHPLPAIELSPIAQFLCCCDTSESDKLLQELTLDKLLVSGCNLVKQVKGKRIKTFEISGRTSDDSGPSSAIRADDEFQSLDVIRFFFPPTILSYEAEMFYRFGIYLHNWMSRYGSLLFFADLCKYEIRRLSKVYDLGLSELNDHSKSGQSDVISIYKLHLRCILSVYIRRMNAIHSAPERNPYYFGGRQVKRFKFRDWLLDECSFKIVVVFKNFKRKLLGVNIGFPSGHLWSDSPNTELRELFCSYEEELRSLVSMCDRKYVLEVSGYESKHRPVLLHTSKLQDRPKGRSLIVDKDRSLILRLVDRSRLHAWFCAYGSALLAILRIAYGPES